MFSRCTRRLRATQPEGNRGGEVRERRNTADLAIQLSLAVDWVDLPGSARRSRKVARPGLNHIQIRPAYP
jgi:hypothetical protein